MSPKIILFKSNPQVASYITALKKAPDMQMVIPKDGSWQVKRAGSSKPTQIFDTKKEAIINATEIAKNQGSELLIYNKQGMIQKRNSYGNDTFPPKG